MSKDKYIPNIVTSAPHASDDFGPFRDRTALSQLLRFNFSDMGTAYTVPKFSPGRTLLSDRSRALIDLNRSPEASDLFRFEDLARPGNRIWKPGHEPTDAEKQYVLEHIYRRYHGRIIDEVRTFSGPGVLIDWHNTEMGKIEDSKGLVSGAMGTIVLSNFGLPDMPDISHDERPTSCDPDFLSEMAYQLTRALKAYNLPDEVRLNVGYRGGFITQRYNTRREPDLLNVDGDVHSFQVEYDSRLTHDLDTMHANESVMRRLRAAFHMAMYNTYCNLLRQT